MTRRTVAEIQANLDEERVELKVLQGSVKGLEFELAEAQTRDTAERLRTDEYPIIPCQYAA